MREHHTIRETHDVKEEIIDLADDQIRLKGYNGFSYRDIAGIMDVRRPAIHYHFPSKSDLGVAVINRELRRIAISEEWDSRLSGEDQLKKLIQHFFVGRGDGCMCLTGALTSDFRKLPEALQDKTTEMCMAIQNRVASALERARSERSVYFQGKASDKALLLLSNLLASRLLARAMGSGVFEKMVDQALRDMGSNLTLKLCEK